MGSGEMAAQGNVQVQFNLALSYATGDGGKQDYSEAAQWYRTTADQGNAEAQSRLGVRPRLS